MEKHQLQKLLKDIETYFEVAVTPTAETINRAWVIVGSQAVHASIEGVTSQQVLGHSNEVDLFLINTLVPEDKSLNERYGELASMFGEGSFYYETHGIYADPVSLRTAIFPDDWLSRIKKLDVNSPSGVQVFAPEIHDLALSKFFAYQFRGAMSGSDFFESKDYLYLNELSSYLDYEILVKRLENTSDSRITEEVKDFIRNKIDSLMICENEKSPTL